LNSEFALLSPTPTNVAGQTFNMTISGQVQQGENLFNLETFGGNGRTCAQCHVAGLSFRLTPANIQQRFANLANTFEPQFIGETAASGFDFNLNTLEIVARPVHQSGTDFNNSSGGDLQGVITTPGGGRGKVLARVGPTTYRVFGGFSPLLAGTVSDQFGNRATVVSVTQGSLNALETPSRMRSSVSPAFPQGRALILENIDGFSNPPVFRKSPHLLNLNRTAPFGFSGDIPDLRTFSSGAVTQHFPGTLARNSTIGVGGNPDFRLPTAGELAAMEAFMNAQEFPAGNDSNKFNLDRFVSTAAEQRGRDLFFGAAKCSQCHGGRYWHKPR
jgi:mono/diheme cytochrome c family protein